MLRASSETGDYYPVRCPADVDVPRNTYFGITFKNLLPTNLINTLEEAIEERSKERWLVNVTPQLRNVIDKEIRKWNGDDFELLEWLEEITNYPLIDFVDGPRCVPVTEEDDQAKCYFHGTLDGCPYGTQAKFCCKRIAHNISVCASCWVFHNYIRHGWDCKSCKNKGYKNNILLMGLTDDGILRNFWIDNVSFGLLSDYATEEEIKIIFTERLRYNASSFSENQETLIPVKVYPFVPLQFKVNGLEPSWRSKYDAISIPRRVELWKLCTFDPEEMADLDTLINTRPLITLIDGLV